MACAHGGGLELLDTSMRVRGTPFAVRPVMRGLHIVVIFMLLAACGENAPATPSESNGGSGGTPSADGGGGVDPAGGAGGVAPSSGQDACPGEPHALALGANLSLEGSTSGANNLYEESSCGASQSSGPELVYALEIQAAGTLRVSVTPEAGSLEPSFYLRTACADPSFTEHCGATTFATHWEAPGTAYLFVDGAAGSSGAFVLDVALSAPECGDGVVNPGEHCDDANTDETDGCGSDCQEVIDVQQDTCPGVHRLLAPNTPTVLSGTTTPYVDQYQQPPFTGACNYDYSAFDISGHDRVYRIEAAVTGTLTATVGYQLDGTTSVCAATPTDPGCWDYVLYAAASCPDGSAGADPNPPVIPPPLECSDQGLGPESITFVVSQGGSYFLFVDGLGSTEHGPYNLHVELTP